MSLAPEANWPVTALVLAGGRGSRMGGVDKGLMRLQGVPLVQWALQRLRAQVIDGADAQAAPLQLAINANREWADYAAFGLPLWPDPVGHFAGPLAGFAAGLQHCRTPLLLTVPCDVPLFPLDLLRRLRHALLQEQADMALAAAPDACGTLRWQPVFCLLRASLRPSLLDYIAQGGGKVQAWARTQRCVRAPACWITSPKGGARCRLGRARSAAPWCPSMPPPTTRWLFATSIRRSSCASWRHSWPRSARGLASRWTDRRHRNRRRGDHCQGSACTRATSSTWRSRASMIDCSM